MSRGALVGLSVAVFGAGCGGGSERTPAPAASNCGPATLSNCPQDTLTDGGECPLPPLIEAQGLYTVGCKVTAICIQGMQVCVCNMGANGPEWGCAL